MPIKEASHEAAVKCNKVVFNLVIIHLKMEKHADSAPYLPLFTWIGLEIQDRDLIITLNTFQKWTNKLVQCSIALRFAWIDLEVKAYIHFIFLSSYHSSSKYVEGAYNIY